MNVIVDDEADLKEARRLIGPDAKPSGRLRLLQVRHLTIGRIQAEWVGRGGKVWLAIPITLVDELPPLAGLRNASHRSERPLRITD